MTSDLREQLQLTLGTTFTFERELGGGGMARVFVAEETRLGRRVVVKVLAPELAGGVSPERFEREVRVAARLQHPNIVPLLTAGEAAAGVPYYTMPYVDGESLRARLARGPLPPGEALGVLRDVARALTYAHANGVVHRDVKPENVLLSGGVAVVTDFGIAKALAQARTAERTATGAGGAEGGDGGSALTQVGTSLGTPAYMAPEQAAGEAVDARADLYAWGVVAYEALAGAHPFAGRASARALLAAHLSETPPALAARAPAVPAALAALVTRCLAKDPAERPASADEVLARLDAVGTGESPAVRSGTTRATRLVSALTAVLLLVVVGAAVVASRARGARAADAASVAVLPFESRGPAEQAYFADGLTDAVTGKLVGVAGLTVIDRRSAATYRGTSKPAAQIGKELGVAYLLEGVVTWAKDGAGQWHAQVAPRLVRTRDGTTKWSGEPAVVTPTDPFSAQAEIAAQVVSAIGVAIGPREREALAAAPTRSPEAYELYLRGHVLSRRAGNTPQTQELLRESARLLERATRLDPSFALAFAELARVEFAGGLLGRASADSGAERRYEAALARALAIDPELPEAHIVRARHLWLVEGRFEEAVAAAARAARGKPGDAAILSVLGTFQIASGRTVEGFANVERTTVLDPRDVDSNRDAVNYAFFFRRLGDAERHARRMIAIAPEDWEGHSWLVTVALARGDTAVARVVLAGAAKSTEGGRRGVAGLFRMLPRPLAEASRQPIALVLADRPSPGSYAVLGAWARESGQPDRARAYFDSAIISARSPRFELTGRSNRMVALAADQAIAFAGAGRSADARRAIAYADSVERLNALPNDPSAAVAQEWLAHAFLLLGDTNSALARLERALALPSGRTPEMLRTMWPYASLHGDPRFERLTRPGIVR